MQLCFQGIKNIYTPFNEKVKHPQAKVRERRNFKNPARFICSLHGENNDNSYDVFSWVKLTSQRGTLILNYATRFRYFTAMRLEVC